MGMESWGTSQPSQESLDTSSAQEEVRNKIREEISQQNERVRDLQNLIKSNEEGVRYFQDPENKFDKIGLEVDHGGRKLKEFQTALETNKVALEESQREMKRLEDKLRYS